MKQRGHGRPGEFNDDLNRGDYRGDFGRRREEPRATHHEAGNRRAGHEGWRRGRSRGGYGSQFDAWSSGAGYQPAGFGFGPDESPSRRADSDHDWQATRPARGRGTWAGDWAEENHRGRGPKGYRRSDERIRDEVCEELTDDRFVDASDVTVEVKDGEVTLTGAVPSREQKRRASACAEQIGGVRDVFNQLRINDGDRVRVRAERG